MDRLNRVCVLTGKQYRAMMNAFKRILAKPISQPNLRYVYVMLENGLVRFLCCDGRQAISYSFPAWDNDTRWSFAASIPVTHLNCKDKDIVVISLFTGFDDSRTKLHIQYDDFEVLRPIKEYVGSYKNLSVYSIIQTCDDVFSKDKTDRFVLMNNKYLQNAIMSHVSLQDTTNSKVRIDFGQAIDPVIFSSGSIKDCYIEGLVLPLHP